MKLINLDSDTEPQKELQIQKQLTEADQLRIHKIESQSGSYNINSDMTLDSKMNEFQDIQSKLKSLYNEVREKQSELAALNSQTHDAFSQSYKSNQTLGEALQ